MEIYSDDARRREFLRAPRPTGPDHRRARSAPEAAGRPRTRPWRPWANAMKGCRVGWNNLPSGGMGRSTPGHFGPWLLAFCVCSLYILSKFRDSQLGHSMKAFISYSHRDEWAADRLRAHLAVLRDSGQLSEWIDTEMFAGDHIDLR